MSMCSFILLAHACHCKSCGQGARGAVARPGRVTGHFSIVRYYGNRAPRARWSCVYCGGRVTRYTPLAAAWWQSISHWVGQLVFAFKWRYIWRLP
jgi:hypothetical protein